MPSDALHYHFLTTELDGILRGGRVNKIFSPGACDVVLVLRVINQNINLLISCNPSLNRLQMVDGKFSNTSTASSFCTHLRRYLVGSTIQSINNVDCERIIQLNFSNTDELGTVFYKTLNIELMGRRSNMMLLNPDKTISDILYKASIDVSPNRPLLPGLHYTAPPLSPYAETIKDQIQKYSNQKLQPCVKLVDDTCIDFAVHPDLLSTKGDISVDNNIIRNINKDGSSFSNNTNITYNNSVVSSDTYNSNNSSLGSTSISPNKNIIKFDTLHQAIDYYYESTVDKTQYNSAASKLNSIVNEHIKKTIKKQDFLQKQIDSSLDFEKYKILGELIVSYMYQIKYGDSTATVLNYYDNTEITITLDSKKSPSQNSQNYFKRYNKKRKTIESCTPQLEQVENELEYLQSLKQSIASSPDIDSLNAVEEELVKSGLITLSKDKNKTKSTTQTSQPRLFIIDGYTVQIGKNNIQNDALYRKASSNDIWLHAQKIHGSHAIITSKPKTPDISTITKVAQIVAYFSKAKNTDKVPVDYTQIKNVSKPRGSKPGFVTYNNQKTLWVSPDNSLIISVGKNGV